jgi:hypothetical protein
LGVDLGLVPDPLRQGLYVHRLVIQQPVALAVDPGLVDQHPGVRAEAGYCGADVLVELKYLPEVLGVLQPALRCLVGGQDHAFRGGNSDYGGAPLH